MGNDWMKEAAKYREMAARMKNGDIDVREDVSKWPEFARPDNPSTPPQIVNCGHGREADNCDLCAAPVHPVSPTGAREWNRESWWVRIVDAVRDERQDPRKVFQDALNAYASHVAQPLQAELDKVTRQRDAFQKAWKEERDNFNERVKEGSAEYRKSTWDYIARHYGKVEDWARKQLPEPWKTQFFNCLANGTTTVSSSDYFRMETADKQLYHDACEHAESAERELAQVADDYQDLGKEMVALRSDKSRLEGIVRELLLVVDGGCWIDRESSPGNPYCIYCGVGQRWEANHGHQPDCLIARASEAIGEKN